MRVYIHTIACHHISQRVLKSRDIYSVETNTNRDWRMKQLLIHLGRYFGQLLELIIAYKQVTK